MVVSEDVLEGGVNRKRCFIGLSRDVLQVSKYNEKTNLLEGDKGSLILDLKIGLELWDVLVQGQIQRSEW